jgi:hypothetical protein
MALPPLTPESVVSKAADYLRARNYREADSILRHSVAQGYSLNYLRTCLLAHFDSGRKVFQKMKKDGRGLLPDTVMQLNLEMPDAATTDVYLQVALQDKPRGMLLIIQIHGHTTIPLPR